MDEQHDPTAAYPVTDDRNLTEAHQYAPTPAEIAERQHRLAIRQERREVQAMDEAAGMLEHAAARITHLERQLEVEQAKTSTLALVEQLFLAGRSGQMCCDSRTPFATAAPDHAKTLRNLAEAKATAIDEAERQAQASHAIDQINRASEKRTVIERPAVVFLFHQTLDRVRGILLNDPEATAIVVDTRHILTSDYFVNCPEFQRVNLASPASFEQADEILKAAARSAQPKLHAAIDGVYYSPADLAALV